ncbi:MAG: DNA cytosine methyltransferase [Idiomarina sp.]|nr:DNA cytosine methyltransferase [Idiomarina sp.]
MATGRSVDIAINHDPDAIAMHKTNHPDTEHYCDSVWEVNPREAVKGRPVALCWLSPDCKHFSKAKGGKPVEKSIRGLAWVAVRWAATVKPRVIMLENVEEFKTWGPLVRLPNGEYVPDPKKRGITFQSFVRALKRHGYKVEYKELRACDYGAPTIRKRLFMVARCDGHPIVWPKQTHGDPKSAEVRKGELQPWRAAAECIDWSLPCPSIFERKRPLADNTLKRIAKGIHRFVMDTEQPFIIGVGGPKYSAKPRPTSKPLNTVCMTAHSALVQPVLAPFIAKTNHTSSKGNYDCFRGQGLEEPLQTVTASNGYAVIAPVIARQFGNSIGHPVDKPSATVTAGGGGKSQLVYAFLAKNFGGNYTGPGVSLNEPAHTVTTKDHHSLVTAFMTKFRSGSVGYELDSPIHTITAGGEQKRLGTANTQAVVTSHLVKLRGTCQDGQPVTEPMPTITAGGKHVGEVRAFLLKYYGTNIGHACDSPFHTVTTKERFGLVTVADEEYQIVDIGMRMLQPHELFAAQGFPGDYIIDVDYTGKRYPKAKQVARCGNAVPPQFAEALVRSNLPELCEYKKQGAA